MGEPIAESMTHSFQYYLQSQDGTTSSGWIRKSTHERTDKSPFSSLNARVFKYDGSDNKTLELANFVAATSGAFIASPRNGYWVRLYAQCNGTPLEADSPIYFTKVLKDAGLVDFASGLWVDQVDLLSPQILSVGTDSQGIIPGDDDSYVEIVLIGRPSGENQDVFAIDVDEDWGWKYRGSNVNAFRCVLDGIGGSSSDNANVKTWITLLDWGTTDNLNGTWIPRFNSEGKTVNYQGLVVDDPDWDWESQGDFEIDEEKTSKDDDSIITTIPAPPPPVIIDPDPTLKILSTADAPFEVFNYYGRTAWINGNDTLRIIDDDRPYYSGGALLLEVKEGYFIDVNIMNEEMGFFNRIAPSLSLDPNLLSEDFNGGDSDFSIRLYGGSLLWLDPDVEYSAGDLTGTFFIQTSYQSLSIASAVDDDYEITLLAWGEGVDETLPPPTLECPAGMVWDAFSNACIPIQDNGGRGKTDPFDLIDDMESPFDATDGLIDRIVKTFTFAVNGSFKAIEAVIEGSLIALPALIVIGSAVIAARVIIKGTEKGAIRAVGVGQKMVKGIKLSELPGEMTGEI